MNGILRSFLAAAFLGLPAQANLVVNPGFETGTLAGWTTGFWEASNFAPQSGRFSAITLCGGPACLDPASPDNGSLFQNIPTIPAALYSLTFWFNMGLSPEEGSELRVLWDGWTIADFVNTDTGNQYRLVTIENLLSTGPLTRLEFFGRQDVDVLYLDSVSVDPSYVDPPHMTPEPSTALLVLLFLPVLLRRRCTM